MEYFLVGRLGRPHGVRGEVGVVLETDFAERFGPGSELILLPPLADRTLLKIVGRKQKKSGIVVKFEQIDSFEAASALKGRGLFIPEDKAMKLEDDVNWIHELVGMRVVTESGEDIGSLAEISRGPAHDIYVVEGEKRYLIPAVKEIVTRVDKKNGVIVINPPPGLLEL